MNAFIFAAHRGVAGRVISTALRGAEDVVKEILFRGKPKSSANPFSDAPPLTDWKKLVENSPIRIPEAEAYRIFDIPSLRLPETQNGTSSDEYILSESILRSLRVRLRRWEHDDALINAASHGVHYCEQTFSFFLSFLHYLFIYLLF